MEQIDFNKLITEHKTEIEKTLKENEYIGENGLKYCSRCHTPKETYNKRIRQILPISCRCEEESYKREMLGAEVMKQFDIFRIGQENAAMGARYRDITFDMATVNDNNSHAYNAMKTYIADPMKAIREHSGVYIYGSTGTGKTYLAACMCNALLKKGYSCLFASFARILADIHNYSNTRGMSESEYLDKMDKTRFVFIDDIGKEFLGRESNLTSNKWAESVLFNLLNARTNSGLPTIFTSNYPLNALGKELNLDTALVSRIAQMSFTVVKLSGSDIRQETWQDSFKSVNPPNGYE